MNFLLDTHILLWAAEGDPALSEEVRSLIEDQDNTLSFSVVSIWEIVIKKALGLRDFEVDAPMLQGNPLSVGYKELCIEVPHTLAVARLPLLHKDPFDRILISQAMIERMDLLTHDKNIALYENAPVRLV